MFAVEVDATGISSAFSTVDAATVVVEATVRSRSSTTAGVPDFRWERRFLLLADSKSSPPEVCSPSVHVYVERKEDRLACPSTLRPRVRGVSTLYHDTSVCWTNRADTSDQGAMAVSTTTLVIPRAAYCCGILECCSCRRTGCDHRAPLLANMTSHLW